MRALLALTLIAPLALAGCGDPPLDGFLWRVQLTGDEDLCNAEPVGFQETYNYRVTFDGTYADLAIDADNFASGQIEGCQIFYESVVWGEDRDGFPIRWKIEGEAFYHQGFGCEQSLPENIDWKGTEVYEVVQSDHPDIPPGCTYTLLSEGTYVGEAGE